MVMTSVMSVLFASHRGDTSARSIGRSAYSRANIAKPNLRIRDPFLKWCRRGMS
jgi:hypothetical protein